MSKDVLRNWLRSPDVDEATLTQIARLAELGLSVAATAHDLRQPLSALKMTLQMLRERSEETSETAEDLDEALRQVIRVENLVERTRNLFASAQGMSRIDIGELLDEIVGVTHGPTATSGRVRLDTEIERGLPQILGDKALLEQLVMNLVNNARDAVRQSHGERVVLMARRAAERDGAGVELIVADDGAGVPEALVGRIFEPFYTTKEPGKGTGLGLYIVKRIAEDHGAMIELMPAGSVARLNRGPLATGFRVVFPPAKPGESASAASARCSSTPPPSGDRRALVVEDEPVVRRLVVKLLEREGFACEQCGTGEEAMAAVDATIFDLIIADKNLPFSSGMEVVACARRRSPSTRAVITTGFPSPSSLSDAMALGVEGFFVKPLDVEALRARVHSLFARDAGSAGALSSGGEAESAAILGGGGSSHDRILVAEPDMGVRRSLEIALRGLGWDVETHAGGRDFEAALEGSSCRIVAARLDLLKRAQSWLAGPGHRMGLVVMDGDEIGEAVEAIHAGARGMLVPPFAPGGLQDVFEKIGMAIRAGAGAAP